jgi:plastocyanin
MCLTDSPHSALSPRSGARFAFSAAGETTMRYLIFASILLFAIGCTSETTDVSANDPSRASDQPIPSSTVDPALPPGSSAAGPSVAVHMIDHEIHMPQSVAAGRVVFNIENAGKEDHAFEIEGNGIEEESEVLTAGNKTTMEVNLTPGTYTVYCPVADHKDKGMRMTLTVR